MTCQELDKEACYFDVLYLNILIAEHGYSQNQGFPLAHHFAVLFKNSVKQ